MTFDFWNTLCRETADGAADRARVRALRRVLDAHGVAIDPARVVAACDAARAAFETSWERNVQFRAPDAVAICVGALADVAPPGSSLARRLGHAYRAAASTPGIRLVPGGVEALARLRAHDVALGIVCDVGLTPSPVLRAELARLGVLHRFAHWSFSDEVGVYKPDRRIFEHALAGLGGMAPAEVWHVGDLRRTDVAGARAVGLGTVRVTVVHDDGPGRGPEADSVIPDYAQLPGVLGLTSASPSDPAG